MADITQILPPEAIPVLVQKLEAEKRREEAEEQKALAEAEKIKIEAEKLRAEAREALARARSAELDAESRERAHKEALARDIYHHVYVFDQTVNAESVKRCIETLSIWSRLDPGCDIEIILKSPGGSVIDGLALFDFIQSLRRKGHKVTTVAMGYAASMAGILLQAGTVRAMTKESYVLIHEISTGAIGKISEIEDEVKFVKKIQKRVLDIYASRAKVKRSYFERRWRRKDWWLDSDECLRIGLVDEIR